MNKNFSSQAGLASFRVALPFELVIPEPEIIVPDSVPENLIQVPVFS